VLAAQDGQLVAEDQDLDLFGIGRRPAEHHQLEKAVQRQVDERPDHQHLQQDDSTRRRTIALLITPPLNPRD
jgi:molybdenum cofactor biosynthesis enzyme MoaA